MASMASGVLAYFLGVKKSALKKWEQTPHPGVWHMNIAKLGAHEFLDKPWRCSGIGKCPILGILDITL